MKNLLTVTVVVGSVIQKDGKFLLVQEKKGAVYGLWNLPAGHVDEGETLIKGAIREAKEETGYDVQVVRELGVYHKEGERSVKHIFEAKIIGGELTVPEDELLDVKWLTYEEILDMKEKLRNPEWILDSIEKVRNAN